MNIVIVGGGTAGWLSALFLSKIVPNVHNITVVDSSKIGNIGAGEGSTGLLNGIITNQIADFGCNIVDFLRETNSTLKLGIRYQDWVRPGSNYVQPIDGSYSANEIPDYHFLYSLLNDYKGSSHTITPLGYMLEEKKSTFFSNGIDNLGLHAYHFDASLVGQYFKKICLQANVVNIDNEIIDVNLTETGEIASIVLEDSTTLSGDFFIDASGFNKVLVKKLGIKWESYGKQLPVNSAMPFHIKYKENEIIEPSTLALAQKHGWMWRIPIKNRYGAGYVYSDSFISDTQAHAEIEKSLGHEIDPLKVIKFDSGRLEKFWHKNCLAVGLSSAFLEPLEATSIHATLIQLWYFVNEFARDTYDNTYSETAEKFYNKRVSKVFENIRDFLIIHYRTGRTDTDFWTYMNSKNVHTEFTRDILEICKTRSPRFSDFDQYLGSLDWTLWSHVLAGTENLTPAIAKKDLIWFNKLQQANHNHSSHYFEQKMLSKDLLSNNDFMEKIFNG